jgi:threonine aldolase
MVKYATIYINMPRHSPNAVTKPTAEMTISMIDASVGGTAGTPLYVVKAFTAAHFHCHAGESLTCKYFADDVYGEDPTVNQLQNMAATLLEKEAALFVPSGTMANLIGIGAHCARGEEVILGDECHVFRYEQAGLSTLLSVPMHTIPNLADGTFHLEGPKHSLQSALESRQGGSDPHYPRPAVIALENTHNRCGGAVLPLPFLDAVGTVARAHGLKLHMDGARLMNAAAASGQSAARIVRDFDSVSLCLSKGLGAPVGSILAGDKTYIEKCRRMRKMLGGGMRQAGVIAAPGIVALKQHAKLLSADHAKAKALARGLAALAGVKVDVKKVATNIVFFDLDTKVLQTNHLLTRLQHAPTTAEPVDAAVASPPQALSSLVTAGMPVSESFAAVLQTLASVKVGTYAGGRLRAVTHHQIRDEDVDGFLEAAALAVDWLTAPKL